MSTAEASSTTTDSSIERIDYGADLDAPPLLSIIVPTRARHGVPLLDRLIADLREQTLERFELILVIGDNRQGRAINRGVRAARSEFVGTMDDDTEIRTPELLVNLLKVLDENPDVGLVGASTILPPDAGWFQRAATRQIPRRAFPVVSEIVDSDMVQHPCLAMRRDLFLEIGGEDEEIPRGLDPLLRYKVRKAGYRVVIAPNSAISHPLPESFPAIFRLYMRNGRGSAFVQRRYPERVYEQTDGFKENRFRARTPFIVRALRYPCRALGSLVTGNWIWLAAQLAYAIGYFREYFSGATERNRPVQSSTPTA